MNSSMVIRPYCQDDYEPLASLYGYYALNTVYTYYSKALRQNIWALIYRQGAPFGGRNPGAVCHRLCAYFAGLFTGASFLHHRSVLAAPAYRQGIRPAADPTWRGNGARHGYPKIRATICTENKTSQAAFTALGYIYAGQNL